MVVMYTFNFLNRKIKMAPNSLKFRSRKSLNFKILNFKFGFYNRTVLLVMYIFNLLKQGGNHGA